MRKIILRGHANSVGTDFVEAALFPADTADSELDKACWEAAIENAESFGYEYVEYLEDDHDYDSYITDDELGYYWEEYDPKKHDRLRVGGGSFEESFKFLAERF